MRITFRNQLNKLKAYAHLFDEGSEKNRLACLHHLAAMPLSNGNDLKSYVDTLLFIAAYPCNATQYAIAQNELERVTLLLKRSKKAIPLAFHNSGLPFTPTITRFSHDGVRWLLSHPHCKTTLASFAEPSISLNDVLKITLPSLERSETTAGLDNAGLLNALLVSKSERLRFIVHELDKLDHVPYIKDHLYDSLDIYVRADPASRLFSKPFNRLPATTLFFHETLLKKFDSREILDRPLPAEATYVNAAKEDVIRVIKNAMALTARETDPTTFMDESSLRVFHLERGISIAIYGMVPSRQLPLESYIGYTAFKNGYPAAYGGAWLFGERSNFGINIFESFRNGESGYIMMQLLRVYRHMFGVSYFEIEPFQFGLDNPDGIQSGAYWFYYRFGFRSLTASLRQLAEKEMVKIKSKKGYRSGIRTLVKFTESSMSLNLAQKTPPAVADITSRVTKMIQSSYHGDRQKAVEESRQKFIIASGLSGVLSPAEDQVLTEVSLWAAAMQVKDVRQTETLKEMIVTKPSDAFAYQALLIRYFSY